MIKDLSNAEFVRTDWQVMTFQDKEEEGSDAEDDKP